MLRVVWVLGILFLIDAQAEKLDSSKMAYGDRMYDGTYVEKQAAQIDALQADLLDRVQGQDTLSMGPVSKSQLESQYDNLEIAFGSWTEVTNGFLKGQATDQAKILVVTYYWGQWATLLSLRKLLDLGTTSSWLAKWQLGLPVSVYTALKDVASPQSLFVLNSDGKSFWMAPKESSLKIIQNRGDKSVRELIVNLITEILFEHFTEIKTLGFTTESFSSLLPAGIKDKAEWKDLELTESETDKRVEDVLLRLSVASQFQEHGEELERLLDAFSKTHWLDLVFSDYDLKTKEKRRLTTEVLSASAKGLPEIIAEKVTSDHGGYLTVNDLSRLLNDACVEAFTRSLRAMGFEVLPDRKTQPLSFDVDGLWKTARQQLDVQRKIQKTQFVAAQVKRAQIVGDYEASGSWPLDFDILSKVWIGNRGLEPDQKQWLTYIVEPPLWRDKVKRAAIVQTKMNLQSGQPVYDAIQSLGLTIETEPKTLKDLKLDEKIKKQYGQAFVEQTLSSPLFHVQVQGKSLLESLIKDPENADALVDQAVQLSLENIKSTLSQLSEPADSGVLKSASQSPLVAATFQKMWPDMQDKFGDFVETLNSSGKSQREKLASSYLKPLIYFLPLFIAQGVSGFFRASRPSVVLISRLERGLRPYLAGYFMASLPIVVTDFYSEYKSVGAARKEAVTSERLFESTVHETSFFEWQDISHLQSRAELSALGFKLNVGLMALFMGAPVITNGASILYQRVLDQRLLRLFETIGFEKGRLSWVADDMAFRGRQREAEILKNADLSPGQRENALREIKKAQQTLQKIEAEAQVQGQLSFAEFKQQFKILNIPEGEESFDPIAIEQALSRVRGTGDQVKIKMAERAAEDLNEFIVGLWQKSNQSMARKLLYERVYRLGSRKAETSDALWVDYYEVLGVSRESSEADIKRQFRRLAKEWHPDRHPDESKKTAAETFRKIEEAYRVLGSLEKRRSYNIRYDLKKGKRN